MSTADAPALAGIHYLKLPVYTMEHHTDTSPGGITTIHDPRETAERREREAAERSL